MIQGCVPFDEMFRGAIYEFEKKTPKKSAIKRANTQIFDYDDDFLVNRRKRYYFCRIFPPTQQKKESSHYERESKIFNELNKNL